MTMLLDERLRDLATQTHLLETKVSSLGWMAAAIYDYDHAPAKILYPIDVIIDQLYDHYGTETEVEE